MGFFRTYAVTLRLFATVGSLGGVAVAGSGCGFASDGRGSGRCGHFAARGSSYCRRRHRTGRDAGVFPSVAAWGSNMQSEEYTDWFGFWYTREEDKAGNKHWVCD